MSLLKKANRALFWFGLIKIPLIHFIRPKILTMDADHIVVQVALNRRSKNHLNSMYFGALAIGAEITGGFLAYQLIQQKNQPVNLVFKNFTAEFLKRAEGNVQFTCKEGSAIHALVDNAIESGERQELTVNVIATVPEKLGNEPVATFTLGLSLKRKNI